MDGLEQNTKYNTKFIAQLIDSMLSLINNLVEDITSIHGVQKDISVVETKLAFLATQVTQLEEINKCLVVEERFKEEIQDIKNKIEKIEVGLKKIVDMANDMKEKQITDKKDLYVEHGKMIIIGAILLTVALQMITGLLKKIAPTLSNMF